jgi:hypothetical protein
MERSVQWLFVTITHDGEELERFLLLNLYLIALPCGAALVRSP